MSDATKGQRRAATTGMVAGFAATTMLFSALLSAYVVRRGVSDDWTRLNIPSPLYFSLVAGPAVSVLVDIARRRRTGSNAGLLLCAAAVSLVFVGTHVHTWRELAHSGTASSDFLFVFSATIVLYAGGAVPPLIAAGLRNRRPVSTAYYWHYLNVLWMLLLAFLHVVR